MSKDELIKRKLEYLDGVMAEAEGKRLCNGDDDKEYIKALNSAIQTYRDDDKAKLEETKVTNQKEIEEIRLKNQKELDTLRINNQKDIEVLRMGNQLEIERIKADVTKAKDSKPKGIAEQVLEWAKVIVPVVVPIIAYGIYQDKMLKFEETGTIHSKVGREMHLPKFMK